MSSVITASPRSGANRKERIAFLTLLLILTLAHAAMDGLCAAELSSRCSAQPLYLKAVELVALYNLIAFGGQFVAGLVCDVRRNLRAPLLIGCVLLCGPALFPLMAPLGAAVLLGLGNCIYHAAAGSMVLSGSRGFSAPGIFVSSGALGLALGWFGFVSAPVFFGLLALCCLTALLVARIPDEIPLSARARPAVRARAPAFYPPPHPEPLAGAGSFTLLVALFTLVLVLSCVILRGYGSGRGLAGAVMLLPCVCALGKAGGGVVADLLGFRRAVLVSFLVGCVALQIEGAAGVLLGALALNLTMPLTLRLAHRCFPGLPGTMFGLTAACLLPGAFVGLPGALPPVMLTVGAFLLLLAAGALLKKARRWEA